MYKDHTDITNGGSKGSESFQVIATHRLEEEIRNTLIT